jgi:hypothetical protein
MKNNNDKKEYEIALPVFLFFGFFVVAVPLAAYGFLYLVRLHIPFWQVFIAFLLCTFVIKWFRAMWGVKNG